MNHFEIAQKEYTQLGRNCILKGEFVLEGQVQISSQVEGKVTIIKDGSLTIERFGKFVGELNCSQVDIFGVFKGHLTSSGSVIIRSCAAVEGRIEAKAITIFPGAQVNIEGHTTNEEILN